MSARTRRETDRKRNEIGVLQKGDGEFWFQWPLGTFSQTQPVLLPNSDTSSITAITQEALLLHSVRLSLPFISLWLSLQVQQQSLPSACYCQTRKHKHYNNSIDIPYKTNIHSLTCVLSSSLCEWPLLVLLLQSRLFVLPSPQTLNVPPLHTPPIPPPSSHTVSLSLLSQSAYRHSIEQSMCGSIAPRATIQGDLALMPALGIQRSEGEINQLEKCASWRQDWVASSFH